MRKSTQNKRKRKKINDYYPPENRDNKDNSFNIRLKINPSPLVKHKFSKCSIFPTLRWTFYTIRTKYTIYTMIHYLSIHWWQQQIKQQQQQKPKFAAKFQKTKLRTISKEMSFDQGNGMKRWIYNRLLSQGVRNCSPLGTTK